MADFEQLNANAWRRLRGLVLELLLTNHREQLAHMDDTMLCRVLNQVAGYSVGERDTITVLQDLNERKYLEFEQRRERWTGKTRIWRIGITPKGVDLVEGTIPEDPAVLVR